MKLKLHHVNFVTTDVSAMDKFYRDVLDMQTIPDMGRNRVRDQGYPGDVVFVTDGAMQMHIAEKDMNIGFRTGQAVNPVQHGHIAFRTDDLDAFKRRLEDKGIKYFGLWRLGDDGLEADIFLRSGRQRRRSPPGAKRCALGRVPPTLAGTPLPEVPTFFTHEPRQHHHVHFGRTVDEAGRAGGAINPLRD